MVTVLVNIKGQGYEIHLERQTSGKVISYSLVRCSSTDNCEEAVDRKVHVLELVSTDRHLMDVENGF